MQHLWATQLWNDPTPQLLSFNVTDWFYKSGKSPKHWYTTPALHKNWRKRLPKGFLVQKTANLFYKKEQKKKYGDEGKKLQPNDEGSGQCSNGGNWDALTSISPCPVVTFNQKKFWKRENFVCCNSSRC
jgi:hypothetical protein